MSDSGFKLMGNGSEWLRNQLPIEIDNVLNRHRARVGYATLAGVARPVWTLPRAKSSWKKENRSKAQSVEVRKGLDSEPQE